MAKRTKRGHRNVRIIEVDVTPMEAKLVKKGDAYIVTKVKRGKVILTEVTYD